MLIAFNKPFQVLSQFSHAHGKATLADFIANEDVYPVGRLDFDSEGLILLTDDGRLNHAIADPGRGPGKRYWAQVEGIPEPSAFAALAAGVALSDFTAQGAVARLIDEPLRLWPRLPPVRHRVNIPTRWLELEIHEGKNRQVRRMTAAVGHPTLRLVRVGIGRLDLWQLGLAPGESVEIQPDQIGLPARRN